MTTSPYSCGRFSGAGSTATRREPLAIVMPAKEGIQTPEGDRSIKSGQLRCRQGNLTTFVARRENGAMAEAENEVVLRARGAGSTGVRRQGNVVLRPVAPWTATVHSLLRHLEEVGFSGAPRVVGSGFAPDGRETLSYIEGEFTHPGPWTIEGAAGVGHLLR